MFILGEGAAGAMGEVERRKFTAEEGVSSPHSSVHPVLDQQKSPSGSLDVAQRSAFSRLVPDGPNSNFLLQPTMLSSNTAASHRNGVEPIVLIIKRC